MPTCLVPRVARVFACFVLCVLSAAPAAAQTLESVPSVVGMEPEKALAELRAAGFTEFVLRIDGEVMAEADVGAAKSIAVWTSPPEWKEADVSSPLEVGFETKVRVANHVGQTGGNAKDAAARIGYVLVEGDIAAPTTIPDDDTRTVDSYHSSSPPPGTLVSVGAYVGVILVPTASPEFGLAGSLIAGVVAGVVVAAVILKMKSSKT